MRIGTYNVLGLRGQPHEEAVAVIGEPGNEANVAHYVEVFGSLDCDVLALQEGVAVRTMQRIARGLGRYLATMPSPIAFPGHVLSRWPILESRTFSHLDPAEDTPPYSRTAGAALLAVGRERLWVFNLHLHPGDVAMREREAEILGELLPGLEGVTDRVIVLGDFNCPVEEAVHGLLAARGYVNSMATVGGGIQLTMDTVGIGRHRIDHIYVSPALADRLRRAEVVRRPGFRHDGPQVPGLWVHSDHLPVLAELAWP